MTRYAPEYLDPDSLIVRVIEANAFLQACNAQIALHGQSQVILAASVTNQVND